MTARVWHGIVAVLVLLALVLQLVIAARLGGSPHSTATGLLRGSSFGGRLIRVLSFFTIQSNILSGIVSAQLAIRPGRGGPRWCALRLAAMFGITVTGVVYSTVLAKIHEPNAGAETVVNTIVHYLVPIMMVLGWVLFGPRPRIERGAIVGWSLLFPIAWLAYTLVRGAIWHWYPYPFLDVASHGYATVAVNCVLVCALFLAVAVLFAFGDRRLPARP